MNITLYKPSAVPQQVPPFENAENQPMERVAELLGCHVGLVDVQACGPNYVIFTIFDYEGPINLMGMAKVNRLTGVKLDPMDEHDQLCGSILVVTLDA